ncbi:MAG: signal peptidase [Halovenus sp.]|jgi:signal peptidase
MSPRSNGHETDTPERGDKKGRDAWKDTAENEDDGDSLRLFLRDLAMSIAAVLLLGGYLFAMSGVWPPMVAIESGSMEPNMQVNDLAFVMDTDRFPPAASEDIGPGDTGVVTAAVGAETGYSQFGNSGDVIVYQPNGNNGRTPIIHRAMFWVEEGENWCTHEAVNPDYLGSNGNVNSDQCQASHSGFITKGDDNPSYDQVGTQQISAPVRPDWIIGIAETRIPWLGWFRLQT